MELLRNHELKMLCDNISTKLLGLKDVIIKNVIQKDNLQTTEVEIEMEDSEQCYPIVKL